MMKRHVFYVGLALLAAMVLFGAPLTASAAVHPEVTLKDTLGSTVTSTTPYSTKMTCGGCHFNCSDSSYSTVKSTWCTAGNQKDCTVAGNCPDYASHATADTTHQVGYPTLTTQVLSGPTLTFTSYTVKEAQHGAVTGIHSQHGRNENLTSAQRTIWGLPGFASGTGMYGRY
jgi:hypothetical protein